MELFDYTPIFQLYVGFGFAFTIEPFQVYVLRLFTKDPDPKRDLDNLEEDLSGLDQHFTAGKELAGPSEEIQDVLKDALTGISNLKARRLEQSIKYETWLATSQVTHNFATISLLSAFLSMGILIAAGCLHIASLDDDIVSRVYSSLVSIELLFCIYVLFLYLWDVFNKKYSKPYRRLYSLVVFLLLLMYGAFFGHKITFGEVSSKFVIISILVLPVLHYLLYFTTLIAQSSIYEFKVRKKIKSFETVLAVLRGQKIIFDAVYNAEKITTNGDG